ncbi:MAG: hypothetical protein KGL71_07240, partial [Xanthomonadaceae bacterium]|nr:hypothetical protein [Xanthomonadaceae bacterium]
RDVEVAGSNPVSPTNRFKVLRQNRRKAVFSLPAWCHNKIASTNVQLRCFWIHCRHAVTALESHPSS